MAASTAEGGPLPCAHSTPLISEKVVDQSNIGGPTHAASTSCLTAALVPPTTLPLFRALPPPPFAVEAAFEQELRRRGMGSGSFSEEEAAARAAAPRSPFDQEPAGSRQQSRTGPRPPPSFRADEDEVPPQLAKSRALNSEGLEVRMLCRGCSRCRILPWRPEVDTGSKSLW